MARSFIVKTLSLVQKTVLFGTSIDDVTIKVMVFFDDNEKLN